MNSSLGNHEIFEQITQTLFMVRAKNNGRFPYSHSILILCEDSQAVLIDTGCGLDTLKKIQKTFNIRTIINSHTHPDHSAGNWLFQNDCSIYVPEEGFESSGNILALCETSSQVLGRPDDQKTSERTSKAGESDARK